MASQPAVPAKPRPSLWQLARRDRWLLALLLPVAAYFAVFHYGPMYGLLIAFKNFSPARGILGSPWAGLRWFSSFFNSVYFVRLLRNTVLLSVFSTLFGFPVPILFALLLNELRDGPYKRVVQTVSYLPHFISVVVICGMVINFLSLDEGIVNRLIALLGGHKIAFLNEPGWFRTIYVASDIWRNFGWNSIIFLAAITGVDPQLYEAARLDGARRLRLMVSVTLPSILPTIVVMLVLEVGQLMNVGYERIILLYNPVTYETADVIASYIYRRGILQSNYSLGAAVGFFNSTINLLILVAVNRLSKRVTEVGLW